MNAISFVIPTEYGALAVSIGFDFLRARIADEKVGIRTPPCGGTPSDFVVGSECLLSTIERLATTAK
jgi:hypothetical protein